jgi:hypothetical protein
MFGTWMMSVACLRLLTCSPSEIGTIVRSLGLAPTEEQLHKFIEEVCRYLPLEPVFQLRSRFQIIAD